MCFAAPRTGRQRFGCSTKAKLTPFHGTIEPA